MGDNDLNVEHTVIRVGQMAGTLGRVLTNDAVAFPKASDFLASIYDGGNYLRIFRRITSHGKGINAGLFWGDRFFLQ